jgi:hypothetical protein
MFALLYRHAYNKRDELMLTPLEIFDVKMYAGHHLVSVMVGVVAMVAALALPSWLAFLSPMCFALMGPGHYLFGVQSEKHRNALAQRLEPAVLLQPRNVE